MNAFVRRHAAVVLGFLSGFDRLLLRGTLRAISYPAGMLRYLFAARVLLKDFGGHAERVSSRLKDAALQQAQRSGCEDHYLPSGQICKEEFARAIAQRRGITQGPICLLRCVEPCQSYAVARNRQTKRLELRLRQRRCLHLYSYQIHPTFGFMHARLQTWFPFAVQVCLNGREWLARQMDQAGLGYRRRANAFTWLEDAPAAQALLEEQLRADWPTLLGGIARNLHPAHEGIFAAFPQHYYWSVAQSEWASDVLFQSRAALEAIYPRLVRHALTTYESTEVMRFLGHKASAPQGIHPRFVGEVVSDSRRRPEGVRLKHRVNGNSVKCYDKGPILRVEFTMNQAHEFKVYRPKEGGPEEELAWRTMRQGIADLHRRAEVCEAGNDRYLQALAAVTGTTALKELAEPLCRPAAAPGKGQAGRPARRVRALNPLSAEDAALLAAVGRPEFVQNGLRNRDLCRLLYPRGAASVAERRRRSAAVTRKLRLLRAHGLIQKVPKTHRYQVSESGRKALTALLAARDASTDLLTSKSA